MRFDTVRSMAALGMAATLSLAAGCASQSVTAPSVRAVRDTEESTRAGTDARPAPASTQGAETPEQSPGAESSIAAILAERGRGDYPEIEVLESGFTITEQVRVGNDARSGYERALALFADERYADGIALLEGVIETAPEATAPYVDLAIAYLRIDDLEQAEQALTTAALLSPDNPIVHNELGILYRRSGRFDEARTSYEQALAVFGDFHYARRNLAVLCDLYLADLECALANYRAYLESAGADPEVEIWIADIENRLSN